MHHPNGGGQQNYTMEELIRKIQRIEKMTERMTKDDATAAQSAMSKIFVLD